MTAPKKKIEVQPKVPGPEKPERRQLTPEQEACHRNDPEYLQRVRERA